eukprot:1583090-Pleurochrysis_carterae.AAC.1
MMNRVGGGSCSEDRGNAAKVGDWLSSTPSSLGVEGPALMGTSSGPLGGPGGGGGATGGEAGWHKGNGVEAISLVSWMLVDGGVPCGLTLGSLGSQDSELPQDAERALGQGGE